LTHRQLLPLVPAAQSGTLKVVKTPKGREATAVTLLS
jgi:hypothetical protein